MLALEQDERAPHERVRVVDSELVAEPLSDRLERGLSVAHAPDEGSRRTQRMYLAPRPFVHARFVVEDLSVGGRGAARKQRSPPRSMSDTLPHGGSGTVRNPGSELVSSSDQRPLRPIRPRKLPFH